MSDDERALLSLDVTEITNALVRPGGLWREVRVVGETGSTNADLLAQAGAGVAEGLVLVAEAQTAARGGDGSAAEVPGLRERLLADLLAALSRWYLAWRDQGSPGDADACGLRREYARRCATIGREVVVTMPGAEAISGTAAGVDWAGRLEVRTEHGRVSVTAGDVVHVRPHDPGK